MSFPPRRSILTGCLRRKKNRSKKGRRDGEGGRGAQTKIRDILGVGITNYPSFQQKMFLSLGQDMANRVTSSIITIPKRLVGAILLNFLLLATALLVTARWRDLDSWHVSSVESQRKTKMLLFLYFDQRIEQYKQRSHSWWNWINCLKCKASYKKRAI